MTEPADGSKSPTPPPVQTPVVSAVPAARRSARYGGALPSRRTRSPFVESVKVVLGGMVGLVLAYAALLLLFDIDVLATLSNSQPSESRSRDERTIDKSTGAHGATSRPQPVQNSWPDTTRKPRSQAGPASPPSNGPIDTASEIRRPQPLTHGQLKQPAEAAKTTRTGSDPFAQFEPPPSPIDESASSQATVEDDRGTERKLDATEGEPDVAELPVPRQPVPTQEQQKQVLGQVRDIFKADYDAAKTPTLQIALASLLRTEAVKLEQDPVAKFVMLREAYDAALLGGDFALAEELGYEISAAFDVDLLNVTIHLLTNAATSSTSAAERREIAAKCLEFSPKLLDAKRFDEALALCGTAEELASRTRDADLRRRAASLTDDIRGRQRAWATVQAALKKLGQAPDDPEASLVVGKHLCCDKGQWPNGLAFLAQGSDPELAAVAAKDIEGADEPAKQVELGDSWWALAEARPARERNAMLVRAGSWYRMAMPNLPAGLNHLKTGRRLTEIDAANSAIPPESGNGVSAPSGVTEPRAADGSPEPAAETETGSETEIDPASQLIDEAQKLVQQGLKDDARKKLLQVNNLADDHPQACFYLGLLAGLAEHDTTEGRRYFTRARKDKRLEVACLNNLAILEVRDADAKQAIRYWKDAIALDAAPEVHHNIGVLFSLADQKRVDVPAAMRSDVERQLAIGGVSLTGVRGGWRYMDYAEPDAETSSWHWPDLTDRTCMHCNGVGTVNCPASGCSRGQVRVKTVDPMVLPGNQVVMKDRLVPVACRVCRGAGRVPCPICRGNGVDRDL